MLAVELPRWYLHLVRASGTPNEALKPSRSGTPSNGTSTTALYTSTPVGNPIDLPPLRL